MKSQELREKTAEELIQLQEELVHKLWKLRFDNHVNQLDDTSSIQRTRRDLARVKTLLTEHRAIAKNQTEA